MSSNKYRFLNMKVTDETLTLNLASLHKASFHHLMKIALVAPPFLAIPPKRYGGTELFLAGLVCGLKDKGVDILLYANGESTVPVEVRFMFDREEWPIETDVETSLKVITHSAWAIKDASDRVDLIHVNSAPAVSFSRFVDLPLVHTIHHA